MRTRTAQPTVPPSGTSSSPADPRRRCPPRDPSQLGMGDGAPRPSSKQTMGSCVARPNG